MDQGMGGVCIAEGRGKPCDNDKVLIADQVDIVFFVEGKGKGEDVVLLVVGTAVVEDILGRNPLPERESNFVKCAS